MWAQFKHCVQVVLLGGAILSLGCGSGGSSDTSTSTSQDDIAAFIESNPQYAASSAEPTPASGSDRQEKKQTDPAQQSLDLGN